MEKKESTDLGDLQDACLDLGCQRRGRIFWLNVEMVSKEKETDEDISYITLEFDWIPEQKPLKTSTTWTEEFLVTVLNGWGQILAGEVVIDVHQENHRLCQQRILFFWRCQVRIRTGYRE